MPKFNVGDKARDHDTSLVVEVLEVGECPDAGRDYCPSREIIRAIDPRDNESDWFHADEFEKVA